MKRSGKVYVVVDDSALLLSLEAILATEGYAVECFTSAEDFLEYHHPTQVGSVLVDLLMPGIGAGGLLRQLRNSGSVLSVVVVSGLLDRDELDVHDGDSVLLLEMPYEVSTLLTMVEDGIAGSMRRCAQRG